MKVYTRTGDDGTTGSYKGGRVAKDHPMMEAIGEVDELNSFVGFLISHLAVNDPGHENPDHCLLIEVQSRLFDIGAALASSLDPELFWQQASKLDEAALESAIDRLDNELPEIRQFILPGGSVVASLAHLARAVCRRAERRTVSLQKSAAHSEASHEKFDKGFHKLVRFLNRLSDYLFVLARSLNKSSGNQEVFWQSNEAR